VHLVLAMVTASAMEENGELCGSVGTATRTCGIYRRGWLKRCPSQLALVLWHSLRLPTEGWPGQASRWSPIPVLTGFNECNFADRDHRATALRQQPHLVGDTAATKGLKCLKKIKHVSQLERTCIKWNSSIDRRARRVRAIIDHLFIVLDHVPH